jgi:hypothetical protein
MRMVMKAEVFPYGNTGWKGGEKSSFGNEKLAMNINIFGKNDAGGPKTLPLMTQMKRICAD